MNLTSKQNIKFHKLVNNEEKVNLSLEEAVSLVEMADFGVEPLQYPEQFLC